MSHYSLEDLPRSLVQVQLALEMLLLPTDAVEYFSATDGFVLGRSLVPKVLSHFTNCLPPFHFCALHFSLLSFSAFVITLPI